MNNTPSTPIVDPRTTARFWSKVRLAGECWEWTAATSMGGYGKFYLAGKYTLAHRVSYEAARGPIPAGLVIDHLCRNAPCVNPAHLEAVTQSENLLRSANGFALTGRCVSGRHEASRENIYISPAGKRACAECRRSRRKSRVPREERPDSSVLAKGDRRHGTVNGYTNLRCRCAACKQAMSDQYLARKRERGNS